MPVSDEELAALRATLDPVVSAAMPSSVRQTRAKQFGTRLYAALTADDAVSGAVADARAAANPQRHGLRITLLTSATPELAGVPWELMHDGTGFLAQSVWTPIVRHLGVREALAPLPVSPPIRVLGMVSNPSGAGLVEVDSVRERELLEGALDWLVVAGLVEIRWLKQATLESLQQEVAYGRDFHVFHFIGHGETSAEGEGILLLEDRDGGPRAVTGERLGTLLCERRTLRLAVLNACEAARTSAHDPLTGVAGGLVLRDVPAVVAMQTAITDDAAVTLSRELYQMLSAGHSVDGALTEVRRALSLDDSLEWAVPVLFMRTSDGALFDIPSGHEVTMRLGRPRFSVDALRRADAAGDAQAAYDLGRVLGDQERWEEAEAAYARADERGHRDALIVLGVLRAKRGDEQGALAAYQTSMERGNPDGGHNLGHMLEDRGDMYGAEAAYMRAVELGSRDAPANLGSLRYRRSDRDGAEEAYKIGAERGDVSAINNLGLLLRERGDEDGARGRFEQASGLGSAEGACNLGVLLEQRGDAESALEAFRTADARGNAIGSYNLAASLLRRGDTRESYAAMLRAAQRGHPQAVELLSRARRR